MQGGAVAACTVHTREDVGAIPTPATNYHQGIA